MFLLRYFLAYILFVFSLSANNNLDPILNSYYQSLVNIYSFYYEIDIKIEDDYGKKILDDDLTLDNVLESDSIVEVPSSNISDKLNKIDNLSHLDTKNNTEGKIAIYKEIKEGSYVSLAKVFRDDFSVKNKVGNISQIKDITLSMFKIIGSSFSYQPFIVDSYDLNYIDYFIIYHDSYNFDVIKTTATNYFYRGTLKPEIRDRDSNLFDEIQVKFSKKYNIITKMVLKSKVDRIAISIEVDSVEKIRNDYIASRFLIYNNGKKTTIDLHNIQLSIPIDIENNYKITLDEYIKFSNEENN